MAMLKHLSFKIEVRLRDGACSFAELMWGPLLNLLMAFIYAKISHLQIAIFSRHPRPGNQGQFCVSSHGSF